ncbi:hypothetical protein V6N12_035016 [Hibiscus sabdariffa]|uniref:Reverse transcriptase zinc-binding domain-containing protein n=1 Tax=Hibiscus sabdariffa TaxID=183260 RepID=A0ABR2BQN6_9ROSI
MVTRGGIWNWPLLQQLLHPNALPHILNILVPSCLAGPDRCIWSCGKSGLFSVKDTYAQLDHCNWATKDTKWKTLWRLPVSERIKYFLWVVAHGKLLTNLHRHQRNLTADPLCTICGASEESILHVLRDCNATAMLWSSVIPQGLLPRFFTMDLNSWLFTNLHANHLLPGTSILWSQFFVSLAWQVWKCTTPSSLSVPISPMMYFFGITCHGVAASSRPARPLPRLLPLLLSRNQSNGSQGMKVVLLLILMVLFISHPLLAPLNYEAYMKVSLSPGIVGFGLLKSKLIVQMLLSYFLIC